MIANNLSEVAFRWPCAPRLRLMIPVLAFIFPAIALADLSQTTALSTSSPTNLNLDTGATSNSGGDIQFSSSGITPQGAATESNRGLQQASGFASLSQLLVQLWPGYSSAAIPTATLDSAERPL